MVFTQVASALNRLSTRFQKNPIEAYISGGRVPWSPGYSKFKSRLIRETLSDPEFMARFALGRPLPDGYAPRIDERAVEIPWTLSRLSGRAVLDAGSVLNEPMILESRYLSGRSLVVYSLDFSAVYYYPRVSYIRGDFREPIVRDGIFDSIACISTLEHVGMWPIPKAPFADSLGKPQPPKQPFAYREALAAFGRLLAPGGRLLLTVPFGRKEDHDWLQQFDLAGIEDIKASFGGKVLGETYYRCSAEGWQTAAAEDCSGCRYHNAVRQPEFDADFAAAARAVACLEFEKP